MKLGLPSWLRRGANTPAGPEAAEPPPLPPSDSPLARLRARRWPWIAAVSVLVLALAWAWSFYWSREPAKLWVVAETPTGERAIVGYSTVHTLIDVTSWLLEKPGGYLSNDVLPPGLWLDNMPNFEFGVLTQCRDLARVLRNYHSRSQSQSIEDVELDRLRLRRSEEHTSELQSQSNLVCRLLLEKKKTNSHHPYPQHTAADSRL